MDRRGRPKPPDILTPREWEVLGLIREGLSNEEIAQRLGISIDGVKYHVTEILGKLALENRSDAARWRPEEARPWWLAAGAPLLFWRRLGLGWLSPALAGGLAVAVAAGLGLLVWGLLATRGDGLACGQAEPGMHEAGPLLGPRWREAHPGSLGFQINDGYVGSDPCRLVLVGSRIGSPKWSGVVLRSDDGGQTVRVAAEFAEDSELASIASSDGRTLWAGGSAWGGRLPPRALLVRSDDGGETWREVAPPPSLDTIFAIASSTGEVWLAATADCHAVLLASGDRGRTWREALRLPPADTCANFVSVAVAGTTVIAGGSDGNQGAVMVSHDGGQTFRRASAAASYLSIATHVALPDPDHAYVSGYSAEQARNPRTQSIVELSRTYKLVRTADGGDEWEEVAFARSVVGDLEFSSTRRGYAFSANTYSSGFGIGVTDDGGLTWRFVELEPQPEFAADHIFVATDSTVYAVGDGGLFRGKP